MTLRLLTVALLLTARLAAVAVGTVRHAVNEPTLFDTKLTSASPRLQRRVDRLVINHDHTDSDDDKHGHAHRHRGTHDHEAGPSIVKLCPSGMTWHGRFCVGLLGSSPVWRDICYTTVIERPWLGDSADHISTYKDYYGACPHNLVCDQDWSAPTGYRPSIDCVPITDDPNELNLFDKVRIQEEEDRPWEWRVLSPEEVDPHLVAMGVQIHVKEMRGEPFAAVIVGQREAVEAAEERKRKEKGKAPMEPDEYFDSEGSVIFEEECSYDSMSEGEAAAWEAAEGYYAESDDELHEHEGYPMPVAPEHASPLQCRPTTHVVGVPPSARDHHGVSFKVLRVAVAAFVSATAAKFDKMAGKRPVYPP